MSKDLIQLAAMRMLPWLRLEPSGVVTEASKRAADETFVRVDSKVFFPFVDGFRKEFPLLNHI